MSMLTSDTEAKRPRHDEIVGLDIGGRLYYSFRSTLTTFNAKGSSLATRLDEKHMIPAGSEYKDDRGRTVYFFDRNGDLFQYILDHLRKDGLNLPSFAQKPELWRDLREEAEFYGLEKLVQDLYVTHEITRNNEARGVFYWLGTKKGKEDSYVNPCDRGEVKVFDGLDDEPIPDFRLGHGYHAPPCALIQYKAPVHGFQQLDPDYLIDLSMCEATTKCGFLQHQIFSVVIELCTVLVRPTAYSLRHAGGDSSTSANWSLEASLEGTDKWDLLHEARDDENLASPTWEILRDLTKMIKANSSQSSEQSLELPLLYAETNMRHTWDLDEVSKFYRFFRFTSVPEAEGEGLDAVGFEIFGEIHEP